MELEIKWWMAALAGIVLALVPTLFLWKGVHSRYGRDPELLNIARLSKVLSRGRGTLTYSQMRKLEKADPWVVYRVLLKDYENWTAERQLAVTSTLAQYGYVEASIQMLKSQNPMDRIQGAELLGYLQSPTGVTPLLEALRDSDDEVCLVVATSLKRLCDQSVVPSLIKALEPPTSVAPARVAEIMVALGPPVLELVIGSLNQVSELTRGSLISILGEIGGTEVTTELLRALQDKSPRVRNCAAEALGRIGSLEAGPALVPMLKDEAAEVRARAAQALGSLGYLEALPALQDAKQDGEWTVRASASQAIREIKAGKSRKKSPNKAGTPLKEE